MFKRISSILLIAVAQMTSAQVTYTLKGDNYADRGTSFITTMCRVNPLGSTGDPKYTGPYFFARLYSDYDLDNTNNQLSIMYQKYLDDPTLYYNSSGSGVEFYPHATMHGYFLTKEKLTPEVKTKIKSFMQLCDFFKKGITLNLDMMIKCSGLLASEEWPDIVDKNGKTASEITAFAKPAILSYLNTFFHKNCEELDAFTYMPTNMMYVRMLAEFAKDDEIRNKAHLAYQQMIAMMIPPWNQGLYVANPPRSKGWTNLYTGYASTNVSISSMAWLYFGNPENTFPMIPSMTVTNNVASSNFWVAYKRNISPLPQILEAYTQKPSSYVSQSVIEIGDNFKSRHTYQSPNYGLSTQHEEVKNYANWNASYTWKETKRNFLVWRSTVAASVFSVCQDNPERPADQVNVNILGYGENPFHRVLQQNRACIGIYNVPGNYNNNAANLSRLYVPFTKTGIKSRKEVDGWIICHTGTMMFAFKMVEPYFWSTEAKYQISGHDILMSSASNYRKGSWILETTEITPALKAANNEEEINNFANLLAQTTVTTLDYETETPRLQYKSVDGDLLDITFFGPSVAYSNQYKVNSNVVVPNKTYLSKGSVIEQTLNSDQLFINSSSDTYTLDWTVPLSTQKPITLKKKGVTAQKVIVDKNSLLTIKGSESPLDYTVVTLQGKCVARGTVQPMEEIQLALTSGCYIVQSK